ncbi:hypothetical protein B0E38_04756 [Streptomyces sp. 111WW2]|nr:hypothetical protein [Streptomyces sp. 111WW2]PSK52430.1 hypothetical protein B0E38_04756 [Streptomyces sp. 111WW2]
MSAQSEQEKARQAYEAARARREAEAVRMAQDNARINGAAGGGNGRAR